MKALVLTAVGLLGFGLAGSVWACTPNGGNASGGGASCTAAGITLPCTGAVCPSGTVLAKCDVKDANGDVISCGCLCKSTGGGGPGGFDPDPPQLP